ncbi:MAG: hypothetical protein JNL21_31070 [Myxococcales bacterium]|nr:hypothetical protein [Myxococcales bacterium]
MQKVRKIVASGRALAALVLGISLVKVLVKRAFGVLTGLPLFLQNYGPDRLPPVTPDERSMMPKFSGCFACGRCDIGEAERIRKSRGAYPGVMGFVLASSRSMPDYDAAERALAFVDDAVLAAKEEICPAHVPISALARFVRAKAEEVGQARVRQA